jgi:hypothetical protein
MGDAQRSATNIFTKASRQIQARTVARAPLQSRVSTKEIASAIVP